MSSRSNGVRENVGTMVVSSYSDVVPMWTMKDQFERFYEEIREIVSQYDEPGYVAIAIHANTSVTGHTPIAMPSPGEPDGALIIGRHTRAGLHLARDPTIALRQMVIRVVRGEQGEPEARLLDLNTGQGFHIEGLGNFDGARILGTAFIRIGSYAVMLLPQGLPLPDDPTDLFETLSSARIVEKMRDEPVDQVASFTCRRREGGTQVVRTFGAIVPECGQAPSEPLPDDTYASVKFRRHSSETLVPLTAEQLERGVLLGRYDRCEVNFWGSWGNDSVSRVHLLLWKEGERVLAIDTASSNGTAIDGRLTAITPLPADARMELGFNNLLHWQTCRSAECDRDKGELVRYSQPRSQLALGPDQAPKFRVRPKRGRPILPMRKRRWHIAAIAGLSTLVSIVGLALAVILWEPRDDPPATKRSCIHPMRDFGTDSPALRLYLYGKDSDMCFEYKWDESLEDF